MCERTGLTWPVDGAGSAAGALLDEALAVLRALAPREWRAPAAAAFADALGRLAADVEHARGALRSADDAVRRHRAELAAVRTAIGG